MEKNSFKKCKIINGVFHIRIKLNSVEYTAKSKGEMRHTSKYFYQIVKKEKGCRKELIGEDAIKSNGIYDVMIGLIFIKKVEGRTMRVIESCKR